MLQLYDYFRSSAAFRVRLALNYKQLEYTKININLLTAEHLNSAYSQLNPSKLVPLLTTVENENIAQSVAIIEYLDEVYPLKPLLPTAALARAYVRGLALEIACDIHPLNNLRVLNYLKGQLGHSAAEVQLWYQHWVTLGLASLEQKISQSPFYSGTYCCGASFSLADACLLPQLFNARRFKIELSDYPLLLKIEALCQQHSWVTAAYPAAN